MLDRLEKSWLSQPYNRYYMQEDLRQTKMEYTKYNLEVTSLSTLDQEKVFNELHLLQRYHPSLRLRRSPLLYLLISQVRRNPLHKRVRSLSMKADLLREGEDCDF